MPLQTLYTFGILSWFDIYLELACADSSWLCMVEDDGMMGLCMWMAHAICLECSMPSSALRSWFRRLNPKLSPEAMPRVHALRIAAGFVLQESTLLFRIPSSTMPCGQTAS